MDIKEITDKHIWENFLLNISDKTFLQAWAWGEFQKKRKNKIWRLGVFTEDKLIGICLAIKYVAKRGNFLAIPHAPIITKSYLTDEKNTLEILFSELKKIAKQEKCNFIRVAPLYERTEVYQELFKSLGFIEAPMHVSAYESSWKLDLTPSAEDLLKQMRKTTRYLVRQALNNKDLKVLQSDRLVDLDSFQMLNKKVAKYQKFVPFSFDFVEKEFKTFAEQKQILIFLGKYQEEVIAAALVIFWQGIAFYHQAALDPEYHKLPITYLLQWEIIKEAKVRGCVLYDLWGYINPKEEPNHPWAGPTLFKMGFGGQAYQYLKTQDLPLNKKYSFTFLIEKIRKLKRGL